MRSLHFSPWFAVQGANEQLRSTGGDKIPMRKISEPQIKKNGGQ